MALSGTGHSDWVLGVTYSVHILLQLSKLGQMYCPQFTGERSGEHRDYTSVSETREEMPEPPDLTASPPVTQREGWLTSVTQATVCPAVCEVLVMEEQQEGLPAQNNVAFWGSTWSMSE